MDIRVLYSRVRRHNARLQIEKPLRRNTLTKPSSVSVQFLYNQEMFGVVSALALRICVLYTIQQTCICVYLWLVWSERMKKTESGNGAEPPHSIPGESENDNKPDPENGGIVKTEDTGKIFEKAVCMYYGIDYVGKYKYGTEKPTELLPLLGNLKQYFPDCVHIAEKGNRYDFSNTLGNKFLSAKTTKGRNKISKVAPQVYGQCSVSKFCDAFNWQYTGSADDGNVKMKIQENVTQVLPLFEEHTFDCDILFYNEAKKSVQLIQKLAPISWEECEYVWTKPHQLWNNSTTLKIKHGAKEMAICEFQFHSKSRSNMANRWSFENVLELFPQCFNIVNL